MNTTNALHTATRDKVYASLKRRYRKEKLFRSIGLLSVLFGVLCVVVLFTDIFSKGIPAFQQAWVQIDVVLDPEVLGVESAEPSALSAGNYNAVIARMASI